MGIELQRRAPLTKLRRDGKLYAYYPYPKFPSISITGDFCAMNCKHCGHHYLRHMTPCIEPSELYQKCIEFAKNGSTGVLISGGYNSEGWVPLEGFLDAIERVKRETGLFINVHSGLVPAWLAHELGRVGVDLISFDFIGANETIEKVIGIDKTVKDYERSLDDLIDSVPSVAPHITIGLHGGELLGEQRALEILSSKRIGALVFLVLVPTPDTAFEKVSPPAPEEVGKIISAARVKISEVPLALGCMRPRSKEFELQALLSGIDRIEIPRAETIDRAKELGMAVQKIEACCAVPKSFEEAKHG